jgi:hypothetical protein
MNAPVSLDDVVLVEMLWAGFKALFTVTAILGVMLALNISHSPKLRTLHRPANLEDLFLKLTGRQIRDE